MKTAILYSSDRPTDGHHQLVVSDCGKHKLFVRFEVINATLEQALDLAKPIHGEIVLNTVQIKVDDSGDFVAQLIANNAAMS